MYVLSRIIIALLMAALLSTLMLSLLAYEVRYRELTWINMANVHQKVCASINNIVSSVLTGRGVIVLVGARRGAAC